MPTDNLVLNAGSGGSTVRTLADSSGNEWPASVVCYATTVSAGANVLAVVTTSAGLPVAQQGTWNIGTVTTVTTVSAVTAITNALPAGTNFLGSIAVVSAVTAITNALPAGTNFLGSIAVADQIANLFNGTTALTVKYAAITASSSGANTIVAAVSGKSIYILRWSLSANGNVNVNWQSHTTTGNATGLHYMTQYATAGAAYCPAGIFATTSGEALDLNLSGSVAVGGELTYVAF